MILRYHSHPMIWRIVDVLVWLTTRVIDPSRSATAAAWVQAFCAVAILVLTIFLAKFAKDSADAANKAVKAAEDSVAAARDSVAAARDSVATAQEDLEREWRPDLRIADVVRGGNRTLDVSVANLAKPGVLIERIVIVDTAAPGAPFRFREIALAAGGSSTEVKLGQALNTFFLQRCASRQDQFSLDLEVWLEYQATGKLRSRTPSMMLRATFSRGFMAATIIEPDELPT